MGFLGWAAFFAWRSSRRRESVLENTLGKVSSAAPFCCYCCNFCGECWDPEDFCDECFG